MFSSSLKTSLLTVALSALVASATPALELKVTGPSEVTDATNMKVTTTVKNTGDETLKLLNDPRGVLNKFPAESFAIQHDSTNVSPGFIGARMKYVPATAIKLNNPSSFTTLKPGESVDVDHDLSSTYDFAQTGSGKYTFIPSNSFLYVDPSSSEAVPIFASSADAHQASLSGSLSPTTSSFRHTKRATFNGCSSSEESDLNSAASAAQDYASSASSYTNSQSGSTPRFTTWFGTYSSSSHSTIQSHFNNLNGNDYSSYLFDCTCTEADTYAYVYPDDFGHVYLCGAFWQAPTTGTDSKGGTLIHESSHFTKNAGTQDYTYGQSSCKSLAKSDPSEAIENADSHEYYAENNPSQS